MELPNKGSYNYINLVCPYGNITEIHPDGGIGINPYTHPIRDACVVNETLFGNTLCSSGIDKHRVNNLFSNDCVGKHRCKIKIDVDLFSKDTEKYASPECKDKRS